MLNAFTQHAEPCTTYFHALLWGVLLHVLLGCTKELSRFSDKFRNLHCSPGPYFVNLKLPPPIELCLFFSCSRDLVFGHARRTSLYRHFAGSGGVSLDVLWQAEISPWHRMPNTGLLPDLDSRASVLGTWCWGTTEDVQSSLQPENTPSPSISPSHTFYPFSKFFTWTTKLNRSKNSQGVFPSKVIGFCVTQAGTIQPFCSSSLLVTDNVEDICAQSYQIFQLAEFLIHWLIQTCWSARLSFQKLMFSAPWVHIAGHVRQHIVDWA